MFSLPLALFLSVGAVAVFSFVGVAAWSDSRRKEREAYYKSETLKKLAEAQGTGASSAVELVKEEERIALRRRLEGQKLGGLITVAVGVGLMVFLKQRCSPIHTCLAPNNDFSGATVVPIAG